MTTETKNPDYSASAVNLNNTEFVKKELDKYLSLKSEADSIRGELEQTELFRSWIEVGNKVSDQLKEVKEAIDRAGSYQDVETGRYALKQRKISKSYNAEIFAERFSKYAPAVIEQIVNVKALAGLIKGKLITEDELDKAGVVQESESFAYIIK